MPIHTHKSSVANQEIPTIYKCDSNNRENQTVVADLDGTLLVGRSSFPYFVLVAFDVGGILRLLLLLLAAPLVGLLYYFISESAGIKLLVFATFAGVKVSDIESAARAVLPKHYSEDLHPVTWRVFASCGRKVVLTANPRIMVEPFLKDYLGADEVLGTEILSYKGVATGFVAGPGVVVGENKAVALRKAVGEGAMPDIGIGDRETDLPFMKLCKEKYIVPEKPWARPVTPETLPKPVIFHDGRLVKKPTPLRALLIVFWLPIGVLLSILRIFIITRCPISLCYHVLRLLGCPISVKGNRPSQLVGRGVAMVCSHRNVVDPLMVSAALRRPATSVSYSVSRITEFMSPIKTHRLTRNRSIDAKLINDILEHGSDLVMFPEGTTCRTPYLLRFSSLFAELTDRIVPVAISIKTSMFHGSTARGYKCLDTFFLFMNPFPTYEITFLDMLPADRTCGAGGRSSYEVANDIQEMIAKCLNFKCTNLTRKDKYRVLARTDGLVGQNS